MKEGRREYGDRDGLAERRGGKKRGEYSYGQTKIGGWWGRLGGR
jgi:hypothetical protein